MSPSHAWIAIVMVLAGSAAADGKDTCAKTTATSLAPLPLTARLPKGTVRDVSSMEHAAIRFTSADDAWTLSVRHAHDEELGLADVRATIEAEAKADKAKLTWTFAERTADGYRYAYERIARDGVETFVVVYLRDVDGRYLCRNVSHDRGTLACVPAACESLAAR